MTATPVRLVIGAKLPPVAVQVTPALSLVVAVTESVWLRVTPARFGETDTVILEELAIVNVKFADRVSAGLLESVTWKVRAVLESATVGVPVIAPVLALSDRPVGKVPLVSDQV